MTVHVNSAYDRGFVAKMEANKPKRLMNMITIKTRILLILAFLVAASGVNAQAFFRTEVHGEGQAVILIPGLTCDGSVWDETVAHLGSGYECHVLTLAGFAGQAPVDYGDAFLPKVKDAIRDYIREQGLEKPLIVGHSLGGYLGLWLGTEMGDELGGLLIVDSLPFATLVMNPSATEESAKVFADNMRKMISNQTPEQYAAQQQMMLGSMISDPEKIKVAAAWSSACDFDTVGQSMYDMYTHDLRDELADVTVPTVVLGSWIAYKDYGSTKESTRRIFESQFKLLPDCQIVMSEAGKHFLMWDDAELVTRQLDALLERVP